MFGNFIEIIFRHLAGSKNNFLSQSNYFRQFSRSQKKIRQKIFVKKQSPPLSLFLVWISTTNKSRVNAHMQSHKYRATNLGKIISIVNIGEFYS